MRFGAAFALLRLNPQIAENRACPGFESGPRSSTNIGSFSAR